MKNKILVMLIAVVSLVCLAQAEVQDNYGMSQTQIARDSYNSTYGAGQVIILGQIATTPQDNYGDSLTQIARKKYNQTYGADQVVISTSAGKQIGFTNFSGLQDGDIQYYSSTGTEWLNTDILSVRDDGINTDTILDSDTNTVFGMEVLKSGALIHTTGDSGWYNTGFGYQVFYDITSGQRNTAIGGRALSNITTAASNTAVGDDALLGLISGDNNTAVGRNAGLVLTGSNNIFIGYNSGDAAGDASNNIIVGYDIDLPTTTTSNWLNIGNVFQADISTGAITLPEYTRSLVIPSNSAVLGPTAPQPVTVGTYRGLGFDADAENTFLTFEVPNDWNGASDMTLKIYWTNEPADALANTETVKYDMSYRVIDHDEDLDAGTAATGTVTYTQSGAGTDGTLHESTITLDYDNANQPLVVDHVVGILFDRDMTGDTYTGDAVVIQWEVDYTSNSIPKHD